MRPVPLRLVHALLPTQRAHELTQTTSSQRSSTAPHYGFFVLNRNGLEYVQEFLTPQCEVEVGGEFILYEQSADAGASFSSSTRLYLASNGPAEHAQGELVSSSLS